MNAAGDGMSESDRRRWAAKKASTLLQWDRAERRPVRSTVQQLTDFLLNGAQEGDVCLCCRQRFVWAQYSEKQPTLDRIDNTCGHDCTNLMVTCLRCNRERGSRCPRRKTAKRKRGQQELQRGTPLERWLADTAEPSEL